MEKISQFADKIGMGDKNSKANKKLRREQRIRDLADAQRELEEERNEELKMVEQNVELKMVEDKEELKMIDENEELKMIDENEESKMIEQNEELTITEY